MPPAHAQATSIRFQGWELRPLERVLLVHGEPVAIGSRAFGLLVALVERRGQPVSKSDLLDHAWPGLVVEENNVSVQIAALRKVLGAQAIATVAGVGYQLSAAPEVVDAGAVSALPRAGGSMVGPAGSASSNADLVGRDADIDAVTERCRCDALVSIVGTGGVGKTSLAKAVVARLESESGGDVCWIDLAPLRDGAQLVPLVARALGVESASFETAHADLIAALAQASPNTWIAIDNCEHLRADVARLVGDALVRAPRVRWLATSQEPLHLADETMFRLAPLGVPRDDASLAEAMRCGALALLAQRITAADRHFRLDAGNLGAAIDLCRQLDGLPLAIEMAASRVATLGLHVVHEQLGQRLRLLAGRKAGPARHHTLRSTFDWSHDLLEAAEQKVFRRLEPFLGGFRAAMAQQLAKDLDDGPGQVDEWQVLDALSALVDKSLVHRSIEDPGRFFLFESAREYAGQRLADAGETEVCRRRHAHVVAAGFDTAHDDFNRLRDEQWAGRYVPERHNVRAALAWACEAGEPDLLASLVTALARVDSAVERQSEIVQCPVPLDVLGQAMPSLRAAACLEFSWAHYADGNRAVGTELVLRALDDFKAIGDAAGTYQALAHLIRLYESRPGKLVEARQAWQLLRQIDDRDVPLRTRLSCAIAAGLYYEETRTIARLEELEDLARRSGFDALAGICRVHITDQLLIEGRFAEAAQTAQRFLEAAECRPRAKALMLANQALALVQLGRYAEATAPARASLRSLPGLALVVVDTFALAAVRQGRHADAAMLAGYGAKARRDRDEQPDPAEAEAIAATLATLPQGLSAARIDELMRFGATMSTADALALALTAGESDTADANPATAGAP